MESISVTNLASWTWETQTDDNFSDVTTEPISDLELPSFGHSLPKKLNLVELGENIHKYCMPPILFFGLIGNILSFIIMGRPYMCKSSASVYFRALAILDSIGLIHHSVSNWILHLVKEDFRQHSDILCMLSEVLFGVSLMCPAWVVVAISAERCVITWFPLKGKLWCTRRTARIAIGIVCVLLSLLVAIPVLSLDPLSPLGKCDSYHYRRYAHRYGWWVVLVVYTLIPTPLLISLNSATIYKLYKARQTRSTIVASADTRKSNEAIYRASFAAVLVAVTYFFLTLPGATMNAIYILTDLRYRYPEIRLVHRTGLVLRTTNNAINFLLYLVSFPKIRAEFMSMMTVCCPRSIKGSEQTVSKTKSTKPVEISPGVSQENDNPDHMTPKSASVQEATY